MNLEGTDSSLEEGELSKDDLLALLNADDDETDETDEPKKKSSKPDVDVDEENEDDDEDEDEDEDEEDSKKKTSKLDDEDDEEENLVTPVRRKEILAKYPQLFKDFPHLEKASYSDQQFRDLFGTHDDAREAADKASALDGFEGDLREGNTETILKAVKDADEDAFRTLVDNYLPTLAKVDSASHLHVITGVLKNAITVMNSNARSTKNDELGKAVAVVHRFLFQSDELTPHQKLGKTVDTSGKDRLEAERQEFLTERYETARGELGSKIENALKGTVDESIDPKDSMTPYVKRNAIRDTMATLDQVIRSDKSFMRVLDGLWKKAAENKFSAEHMKRIRSTYLSKAKTHLPAVIKRSRREALQGQGKASQSSSHKSSSDSPERTSSGRRPQGKIASNKSDGRGMSTADFFNS